MTTDRKLLELAAKAVGFKIHERHQAARDALVDPTTASLWIVDHSTAWHPLKTDGDAMRLAVKLEMCVSLEGHGRAVAITVAGLEVEETNRDDPYAATRRAIVRAAAEIGKGMK